MSPVPGATTVVGTGLAPPPPPNAPAATLVTTATTTTSVAITTTSHSRVPAAIAMSSQQQSSQQQQQPTRTQHHNDNGKVDSKNKHHFNNNNNIKNNNCNNNMLEQSQNKNKNKSNNNNKLTIQHNGGMHTASVESVRQMKHHQMQQQLQQQTNKTTNSESKAKANDMQKHTNTTKKVSFTHATSSTTNAAVNGATAKSVNNTQFSSPVGNVVGTSSSSPQSLSSSSQLSPAQTNCSTKSPTMKTTTMPQQQTSSAATAITSASSSTTTNPLALSAITSNGATSTPEAAAATVAVATATTAVEAATGTINAETIIKSTIDQNGVEIKEECDPQEVIVKVEETTPTTDATATTTTTAKISTTTVNHQVATPPTTTTNQKDTTAAVAAAAPTEASKKAAGPPLVTADDASADNLIVDKPRKVLLSVMNPHIICHLCTGYLIDATTIVECLHSFCHSCLIKHLRTEQYCPRCEMMINTAKPNIKPDTTLQAIVYKLVPGLYERELMRKRAFYKDRPADAAMATPEQRGEDTEHLIFSPSDCMSLSLEFADTDELVRQNSDYGELLKPRYLQCPAMCTVGHLKKFVHGKFDIDSQRFNIDIMYKVKTIVLLDHYTLMDVAYIYTWKRDAPMRFYFRVKRSLRPIVKARKPAAIMPVTAPEPVEIKDEVIDATITANSPKIAGNEVTQTISPTPDVMTIIPKPVAASVLTNNDQLIMTPEHIKEEEIEDAEELRAKPIAETVVKPPKPAKVAKTVAVSSSTEGKRSQSNSAAERKAEKALNAQYSHNSPKSSKEKREAKEALKQAAEQPRDERKVENIKLKIDLSKHNSVTIINMSDPQRREITKSVRPEKEWKLKNKRDKESSPKNSPNSERKNKTPSPLTVPPLTIKAEQFSPQSKISPLAKNPPKSTETSPVAAPTNEEEQKSQFLKSFALTPIKAVKNETNDKSPKSPKSNSSSAFTHKVVIKSPTSSARDPLKTTISTVFKGPALPSKRKIKEPVKNVAKKPKLSPPLPAEDFKIKLPPSPIANTAKPNSSPIAKPTTTASDKPLMPPPKTINNTSSPPTYVAATITTTTPTAKTSQVTSTTSSQAIMRPPIGLPPKKVSGKMSASAAHKMNSLPLLPSMTRIEMAAPGNRTPIAKRYQPILPKSTRPNPFANIPSDVNKLLKDAGTEIKTIASNTKSTAKVYGPKTIASGTTITADNSLMGPPPAPATKQQSQNVNQPRHGMASNAHKLGAKNGKTSNSNNYLNLALFNASKSKGNEAPPGCRTPMYTPSSPIYSPSSPQYMPNYNIPTVPTYKYTPRPSGGSGSFLQSILGGANNQMAGLFPAPPTMKDNANPGMNSNASNGNSSPSHNANYKSMDVGGGLQQGPKRVYPFARSPSPEDPPEKQLKVKSLLTSCNINIPSSLSITITREDSESQTNNASHPKHKSPVNNYIEILKLPDQSSDTMEQSKRASPPAQKLPPTPHASTLKLLMPPTPNATTTTSSPVKRDNAEGKSTNYGTTTLAQIAQKPQSNASKSPYNTTSNSANKTQISAQNSTKSPQSNSVQSQMNQKHANENNHQKSNMKVAEPLKSPQSEQLKSGAEKKSPMQSPDKSNASSNGKTTHKSPNSSNTVDASKKFRPILPRQNPASTISEIIPPKVTTGNIIGTYSAPSGVAVKVHAAKKVTPPKKSPGAQQQQQQQPQPQVAHQQPKNGQSPNALSAAKPNVPQSNKSPSPAHQSSSKLTTNAMADTTPQPISSPNAVNSNATNKLIHAPHPSMPPAMPSLPTLPAMPNMPPTALQVAAIAAGLPGMPSHLGGVGAADFSKLFKDNLLRAQVQAAAAAAQPGGMFYPYANAQQLSHHYSYQQAFMLEQLTRMQRAEALNEFMQKLKNGPADKPLDNNSVSVGGGKALAVPGPKASPVATTSSSVTSKSNAGNTNTNTTTTVVNSNTNSNNHISGGATATKAK